ncbi:ER membrane protein complex subunit 6 [Smittium culicis]|uniref:ER membrane protein complex subunit 6 n=1 Tax=Smittium culicis TaxID=133412 RepID=A0A1R1XNS5_9FUNG|nr:ER membrane protein complex subunit 6 [Smittium culicis]
MSSVKPVPSERAHNDAVVGKNRFLLANINTLVVWAIGAAAGILGLTSYKGFIFFAVFWLLNSAILIAFKCGFKHQLYFKDALSELVYGSAFGSLLTYILVWTLFYGLIYIYE